MIKFTNEERRILKEFAQEKIRMENIFLKDKEGKRIPYKNRFETWDDAHYNMKRMGISEEEIIKSIGKKDEKKT